MSENFNEIYQESIKNPEKFWQDASHDIFWFKKPTKILNKSNPPFYKWYEDGVTNTCYNALDYHIDNGKGDKTALIYDSPITGNKDKFTYNELRSKVSKFAGALKNQGVNKGDRVIIYMPMIPEAVLLCLHVQELEQFIQLCLVDLPQMNLQVELMTVKQSFWLLLHVVLNQEEPLNTNH